MDSLTLVLGVLAGGIIAIVSFILGTLTKHEQNTVQRQKERDPITVVLQTPQVSLPQEQEEKEPKKRVRPGELGAVARPTAEELDKDTKPIQKAEDEEMEKSLEEVFGESIASVAKNTKTQKGDGGIWMQG